MKHDPAIARLVLEFVSHPNYQPIKPGRLARELELAPDDRQELKRALKHLVKTGHIAWGPQHLILKSRPTKKSNERLGRFRRAAGGYGFVSLEPTALDQAPPDIFVPEVKTLDAADRDLVRVRFNRRKQGSEVRYSGRIIEVIERANYQFVGTYLEKQNQGWVQIDGTTFSKPVLIGDASAKNCRVGDKVVIEMVHFPSPQQRGEGVIIKVLGDRRKVGVDTQLIIHQFGLPGEFPDEVLENARHQAEEFDKADIGKRTDFTGDTVITIDPKTARDFDDAISLVQRDNGHWLLGVHIADVSHFVRPGSALDDEAFQRATSVYLPDQVIPMLPETISNNLASLQPKRLRYTMSAVLEFSSDGVPIHTDLHRGAIRSAHRFNYEEIDDYLTDDRPWKKKLPQDVFRLVRDMHTLAMRLRSRRMQRGAFDLIIPDIEIDYNADGRVVGAHKTENTESHQIIEEFMLAANEAVAQVLVDRELNFLRRIHEAPSDRKLRDLKAFLREVGIKTDSLHDRFDLNEVVEMARGRPLQDAVNMAVLRSMQKAIYSPRDVGHFALASKAYCHFTSPIRRYPDLVIHRMLAQLIRGKRPADDFGHLVRMGQHCSDMEQRAETAERELVKLKLLHYFKDRIGEQMDAVVTGVEAYGLFAQGVDIPADGLVSRDDLPADRYQFDRASRTLTGNRGNRYQLGDKLRVEVAKVDLDARQLNFHIAPTKRKQARKHK